MPPKGKKRKAHEKTITGTAATEAAKAEKKEQAKKQKIQKAAKMNEEKQVEKEQEDENEDGEGDDKEEGDGDEEEAEEETGEASKRKQRYGDLLRTVFLKDASGGTVTLRVNREQANLCTADNMLGNFCPI
jgi:hypothetical protein